MLVYQLLKQQMDDELDAILEAYRTNMRAGQYNSQFNGQNVDGEFVMDYYRQMLAGFPPGSTEYETINSKLKAFEQQYQDDIQNLIINSMNNGTKIDFGLLGSGFSNKGISEVSLSDIRGWSQDRIAELEADGRATEADALRGTVYVAGFNVEFDGKKAAYTRGDITASQMADWLKGQLKDALAQGLTKESQAYRDINIAMADYLKTAKTEGQNAKFEEYQEKVFGVLGELDKLAGKILEGYDGAYKYAIMQAGASGDENFGYTPNLAILNKLAEGFNNGTIPEAFNDIMEYANTGAPGDLQDLFSQASLEAMAELQKMKESGFSGVSDAQLRELARFTSQQANAVGLFVANAGARIEGSVSAGLMSIRDELKTAGMMMDIDQDTGRTVAIGGHPEMVMDALATLKGRPGDSSVTGWMNDLADGYIPNSVIDEKKYDLDGDGKVAIDELAQSAKGMSKEEFSILEKQVLNSASALFTPQMPGGGGLDAVSLISAATNASWNTARLDAGDVMVVNPNGMVEYSSDPFRGGGVSQAIPQAVMYKGKVVTAYVQPAKIYSDQEMAGPQAWPGHGMEIFIYNGINMKEPTVSISGAFKNDDGTTTNQVRQVPLRVFTEYLEKNGIPTDPFGEISDGTFGIRIAEGADPTKISGQWVQEAFLRSNANSIWSVPEAQNLSEPMTYGVGYLTDEVTRGKLFNDAFSDTDGILKRAAEIATNVGRVNPVRADIAAAVAERMPAIYNGMNTKLLYDTLKESKPFNDLLTVKFPQFKPQAFDVGNTWSPVSQAAPGAGSPYVRLPNPGALAPVPGTPSLTPGLAPKKPSSSTTPQTFQDRAFRNMPTTKPITANTQNTATKTNLGIKSNTTAAKINTTINKPKFTQAQVNQSLIDFRAGERQG
jgi:hypothetical protein